MRGVAIMTLTSIIGLSPTVDVNNIKKVIDGVLVSHNDNFTSLPKEALPDLANKLFTLRLINNAVKTDPSMEKFINEFKAILKFMKQLPKIQEHSQKFLNSFIAVGGSFSYAAIALHEDWIEALRNELGFDVKIEIDA